MGYDPEVALCDLIDNCLDAEASKVFLTLIPEFNDDKGETDTISRYILCDNGKGMNGETLVKAFTLGSDRHYPSGSLGKFGLGLKSAGLSLGDRIVILSQTERMDAPLCAILSMKEVESSGEYRIALGEVPDEYQEFWTRNFPEGRTSGTTLLLEELNSSQPSFRAFTEFLRRCCATIYHLFIADTDEPLSLSINGSAPLEARDPLFMQEAQQNGPLGNPADWNGRTPHLLMADHPLALTSQVGVSIALTHLIHPPSFKPDGPKAQNEAREHYGIDSDPYNQRPRHGFYIYRNRRIIVLAERFRGLVGSETSAWAFRGRLMFNETADAILSLDVKKRHWLLPKDARNNLKALIGTYHAKSTAAWDEAGRREAERRKTTKEQYANQSIANTPVASLDYAPGTDLSSSGAVETRTKNLEQIGAATLSAITDPTVTSATLAQNAQDQSVVVPVSGIKGNAMWLPYPAVQQGSAETLVNKQHSWVAEAYSAGENDPRITLLLHQLFTVLARAELEVRSEAWANLPTGAADKVLERFRRKASTIGEDLAESLGAELAKVSGQRDE